MILDRGIKANNGYLKLLALKLGGGFKYIEINV